MGLQEEKLASRVVAGSALELAGCLTVNSEHELVLRKRD